MWKVLDLFWIIKEVFYIVKIGRLGLVVIDFLKDMVVEKGEWCSNV